jgi:hypothetical protein
MLIAATAAAVLVAGTAAAQNPGPTAPRPGPSPNGSDRTTVYATNRHMAFSIRTSVIRWLGGVAVPGDRDVRAAEKDAWWGQSVPRAPSDLVNYVGADR